MKYKFIKKNFYSRKKVKELIKAPNPEKIGGNWSTGYASYNGCIFIFANIKSAGRTGHNYNNVLEEDILSWYGKTTHKIQTKSIQDLINGEYEVYIFTRNDNNDTNFIFQGLGSVVDYKASIPVHITWKLV